MNETILVIEDDPNIGELIGAALTDSGYAVEYAYSGTEALLLLEKFSFDLIISDLMLPGISGEEIVKKVGADIPVIVVSAKAAMDDKVNNLLNGAADYLTKPFSTEELLARVAVCLRKKRASRKILCDDVYIDVDLNTAFAEGEALRLTKTEYALLKILISNPGGIFSKSRLTELVCENGDVWESSINVHICNLRKKIADACGKNFIETIWGIGYRFMPSRKS